MEAVALALLLGMFVMLGLSWSELPERMPSHYNAAGEVDRWGSKDVVWILPIVGAALYLMMTVVSSFAASGKLRLNVPSGVDAASPEVQAEAIQLLTALKIFVMAAFAFITWKTTSSPGQGLGRAFLPMMLIVPAMLVVLCLRRMGARRSVAGAPSKFR
jgi:uncharacterized membrane protein